MSLNETTYTVNEDAGSIDICATLVLFGIFDQRVVLNVTAEANGQVSHENYWSARLLS